MKTTWNKQPKKKRVKSPKQKAKSAAWIAFSRYIRLRDCLATTGKKDEGICVTCGKKKPFKQLQAGHAIPGRNNSILLDEDTVNAQCIGCNLFGSGRIQNTYTLYIITKFGVDFYEEKVRLSNKSVDFTEEQWLELKDLYKEKYELLDKQASLC